MKIALAQTTPAKENIHQNIINHLHFVELALAHGAGMIVFPELSISGYETELAPALATTQHDERFNVFQEWANAHQIIICFGAPAKTPSGTAISMFVFQPAKSPAVYFKKYLHSSEEPFFVSSENDIGLLGYESNIALAICYEISVPQHAADAHKSGAGVYVAGIVETKNDIEKAHRNLKTTAVKYAMPVLMANSVGLSGIYLCAGRSSCWNNSGELVASLDDTAEGIIVFDTATQTAEAWHFEQAVS